MLRKKVVLLLNVLCWRKRRALNRIGKNNTRWIKLAIKSPVYLLPSVNLQVRIKIFPRRIFCGYNRRAH